MNELVRIQKRIRKAIGKEVRCEEVLGAVKLEGQMDTWDEVVLAGKIAAKSKYRGVVNDLYVAGIDHRVERKPSLRDDRLEGRKPDVLVIGGGIVGTSIARELSKWKLDILLIEKESDVGLHQSSRNDGMVHPGVTPRPGTLKAKYNVRGNELFKDIARDLDVPYRTIGTYVMFKSRLLAHTGLLFVRRARKNGVYSAKTVGYKEIKKHVPNVPDDVAGGVYMPTTGVCPPYQMTVAMAESAVINGAKVSLNTYAEAINREGDTIKSVQTNRGMIYPKIVINAAGLFSDKIAEMAQDRFFTIHPRKGQVALLDRSEGEKLDAVVSSVTLKMMIHSTTKGGGLVKTAYGNILAGPSAKEQPYKEEYSTDRDTIDSVLNKNLKNIKGLQKNSVITYLAGNRAATYKEDFIIEPSKYVDNLIYAAGIQSPGYASAPAIAEDICIMAIDKLSKIQEVHKNKDFIPTRAGVPRLSKMTEQERNALIEMRPEYGEIVCRCEEISKGEILDAIHAPLPALTTDAIKRRTRAGMGRCQGGFCRPLITQIIRDETGLEVEKILSKGGAERNG